MNFDCAAGIEFWYWAAANSCCHLKKKLTHTSSLYNRTGMC